VGWIDVRIIVAGAGTSGLHCARALLEPVAGVDTPVEVVLVDRYLSVAKAGVERLRERIRAERPEGSDVSAGAVGPDILRAASNVSTAGDADAVVLCVPSGAGGELARGVLGDTRAGRGPDLVSIADAIADVQDLIGLDARAKDLGRRVVVGAGCSPGLSCLLAAHAAALFERVEEIHVAKSGTGGPACARQHHRSLRQAHWEWRDEAWIRRRASSGRQLVWFPERIGALDCYRAALAEPFLLQRAFPEARRVTARVAATRRDRLTGWLPMLRRPHADGGPGGLRVEVWGHRQGVLDVVVYGLADHPARVAGIMAAAACEGLRQGWFPAAGVLTMADCREPAAVLRTLGATGVQVAVFEGAA
jgi:saccharopine dehydrogenase-like NADP-dependent oxidoreductase